MQALSSRMYSCIITHTVDNIQNALMFLSHVSGWCAISVYAKICFTWRVYLGAKDSALL